MGGGGDPRGSPAGYTNLNPIKAGSGWAVRGALRTIFQGSIEEMAELMQPQWLTMIINRLRFYRRELDARHHGHGGR